MNAISELDDRIHDMLDNVGRSAPPAPAFQDLRPGPPSQRSRLVPVAAAAALVAVGVAGVMVASGDGRDPIDRTPATEPTTAPTDSSAQPFPAVVPAGPDTVEDATAQGQTGPLLTTEIDRGTLPLIALTGWETTYAYSESELASAGGFDDALILVGPGPTYDAPLFAGSIVVENQDGGQSTDELLQFGDPVEVGDVTGSLSITDRNGASSLSGEVSLLFVPLDDGRVVRFNAVRVDREQLLDLALRYVDAVNDGSEVAIRPDGWTKWETPDYEEHSTFSIRFRSPDGEEIEIVGENRGAASLLGRIGGEVRTTRVIGDTEVAWLPQEAPDQFWVDWRLGDWSFYAMAQGFAGEQQFIDGLQQIRVVNESQAGDELVTPDNRAETVDALLADVPVPPGFDAQALHDVAGVRDRYQEIARVSSAVACGWLDVWFDAQEAGDPAAGQPAVDALATATEWEMLIEIDALGGWSDVVWSTADSMKGDGDFDPPTRESASAGFGCNFD